MLRGLHLEALLLFQLVDLALPAAVSVVSGPAHPVVAARAPHEDVNLLALVDLDRLAADILQVKVMRLVLRLLRIAKSDRMLLAQVSIDLPLELDLQILLMIAREDAEAVEDYVSGRLEGDGVSVVAVDADVARVMVVQEAAPLDRGAAYLAAYDQDLLAIVQLRFLDGLLEVRQRLPGDEDAAGTALGDDLDYFLKLVSDFDSQLAHIRLLLVGVRALYI